ncbi:alpha/beta fold hydrolase [Lentzea flaviverrucosa]|uniref:Pimeloyl-ACP methyl ester carboxylesterase n=1 Tax=Lentzea flaviverrucosa TaxID=200379 RepID=A0A1H9HR56_9PSEU|nr:alpha/beta fold hydrolase [Lentzea flaviverrucosa]RDI34499.1 pimeloyl-ACP methyl ester carboxylesterase [Lentzea flaviverrucosa]SEQ64824.1 Pimeloyl-ACP methyl ester carboxylesterase [Lentzea flaviverrucosa]
MNGEPRPVREADQRGHARRAGVRLAFQVYDNPGRPTVLLMPTWSIVPSKFWKAQVPYLARHFQVVTFDGRGSGESDRPTGGESYVDAEYAADAIAVMDATNTDRAVLVALSRGDAWSVLAAAHHPERVTGIVAIGPASGSLIGVQEQERQAWESAEGKYTRQYWLNGGYDDFVDWFFARMFAEPHSTKQIEDAVRWAHEIDPATLVDTTAGRLSSPSIEDDCRKVRCPVLVIHGTGDRIRPHAIGERLAELTGGSLVLVDGAGHGVHARDPVRISLLVKEFVDRVHPVTRRTRTSRTRPPRALYLSSPIGLGHARRDLAIASELRRLHPRLQVDWLAQHPVTEVLGPAGERVHPASAWLAGESSHVEEDAGEHDLHVFEAFRRLDSVLVNNFMVFNDVLDAERYDLVIGDEAWEVDYFLHENPELKRFSFAWLTDFVGWLPMPDGGAREQRLTADYNLDMIEQRARHRRVRDRSVFVGNPDDVISLPFGEGLPAIREWTEQNFDFSGYVTGFDPPDDRERAALRTRIGLRRDEKLCVVTVGGSGVGESLLRRVLDAVPAAVERVPALRFLVVTGPRIDPDSLPGRPGVEIRGYVPDLPRLLAACDLAVVQGGLTTCMELTAAGRPFLFVPLRHHFEQNFHVRHRLERYGAGRCTTYDQVADRDVLAAAIAGEIGREVGYREVEADGAARAAALLAELL